jgi:hypothetical protein
MLIKIVTENTVSDAAAARAVKGVHILKHDAYIT